MRPPGRGNGEAAVGHAVERLGKADRLARAGRLPIDDERPVPGREPRLETLDLGVRDFWDIWDGGRLLPTILASVTAAI